MHRYERALEKSHFGGRVTSPTLTEVRLSPFSSWPCRAQQDKANLKFDLGGLELKLLKVHIQPNGNKEIAKYTKPNLRGEVYFAVLELTLGKSW